MLIDLLLIAVASTIVQVGLAKVTKKDASKFSWVTMILFAGYIAYWYFTTQVTIS